MFAGPADPAWLAANDGAVRAIARGLRAAGWVEYAKPRDNAAYAYILPGGINQGLNGGWRSSTTHGQLIFFPFSGLPAGEYMIYHEVVLEVDGSIFAGWSSQKCVLY